MTFCTNLEGYYAFSKISGTFLMCRLMNSVPTDSVHQNACVISKNLGIVLIRAFLIEQRSVCL